VDVFEAVADPVRRSILESLADRSRTAGDLASDYAISRPAVSRHLRVLREAELVSATIAGREWVYQLAPHPLGELDSWLDIFRRAPAATWGQRLDALETEVRRTTRDRRRTARPPTDQAQTGEATA
jgi:DNA-binding transcriptional ArsR family regulator